jgi:hypothetical protein
MKKKEINTLFNENCNYAAYLFVSFIFCIYEM